VTRVCFLHIQNLVKMSVVGISSSMSEDPSVPALMLRGLGVGGNFDERPLEEGVMMRFLESSRSPYLSTGFIIWYLCLFLCCGVPMLCCLTSYICYKIRLRRRDSHQHMFISNLVDAWEATRQEREEAEIQLEIARIEANVTAFSIHQQKKRRAHLQQSWGEYRMVCVHHHLNFMFCPIHPIVGALLVWSYIISCVNLVSVHTVAFFFLVLRYLGIINRLWVKLI